MMLFWLAGAALAAIALVLALRPVLFMKKPSRVSRPEANLSVYRDQLRELDADLAAGKLAPEDYERARIELESRLLEEVVEESGVPRGRDVRALTVTVAFAVPLCAAALYLAVGNPGAVAGALMGKRELKGVVSLSATLKTKAAPEDTVFIFARAADGPPLPLAVLRRQVRDLPLAFSLDDSMAMAPGMRLSGFPRVIVAARVSKSGNAAARPEDLQGASATVANDADGVSIVIDTIVP